MKIHELMKELDSSLFDWYIIGKKRYKIKEGNINGEILHITLVKGEIDSSSRQSM